MTRVCRDGCGAGGKGYMDGKPLETGDAMLTHNRRLHHLIEKLPGILMPPLYYMSVIAKQLKDAYRFEDAGVVETQAEALRNYLVDVGEVVGLIGQDAVALVEEEQAELTRLSAMVSAHKAEEKGK